MSMLAWLGATAVAVAEPPPAGDDLQLRFNKTVQPFLQTYCHACHSAEKTEAELDLAQYASPAHIARGHDTWAVVIERLEAGEMPPEDAEAQPSAAERQAAIDWIRALRRREAERNAGDPGVVPVRRLSNAEYNATIRDLTGVDIRPTREFPVDPANEAGFDNSAESLAMSPALLTKYVAAARQVAEHLVLQPAGFAFAPHPVMTETDRDKYCVKRIVEFYQRQPTDYADYFEAAWRYQNRAALDKPAISLAEIAEQEQISPKYLALVWTALSEEPTDVGPLARLQAMWRELPAPEGNQPAVARRGCEAMRDYVIQLRAKLEPRFDNLDVRGIHDGSQPFVLWKNRQYAAHRQSYDPAVLRVAGAADGGEKEAVEASLVVPADAADRARHEASLAQFCEVFPDAFYISERGRDYVGKAKDEQEKGRLLSAGFHSMMGYFRDDTPLYELVLDLRQQQELDGLWQELDFITSAPMRQYKGFLWFERTDSRYMRDPEFDFARSEDKGVTAEDKIRRLAEVYLAKAVDSGGEGTAIDAIRDYFERINDQIRWVEAARLAAEPSHLDALLTFAERAYRRPLTSIEREGLLAFYRQLREQEALSHEEAVQDTLVLVLMSPNFCYRMDLATDAAAPQPLSDYELASRLSYFLWSSLPDEALLARAAAGELRQPAVLASEARRMLRDDRVRGLATEFGGNWLDFRRFEQHNSVDRDRFPTFTNELRQAMFEEPIRFFVDLAQHDRPVLEMLYGRHTFVNSVLAEHYGIPAAGLQTGEWTRIDDAHQYGRGGLLPMAVFLTQNAPGLRTSPVKRGYWVVRRLLGERIPPPPPDVPELPADEANLGELTLREVLARHRDHKSCASCHERIDAVGLVFEGFGPIGERRENDLGGRPVDTLATFPGGSEGQGVAGLQTYLRGERQEEFLDNLCRKLLSYAVGRSLLASDDLLVATLREKLAASDYRLGGLVETIVASPQFRTKRGVAEFAEESPR
ncbi:MAG: DUF1592 domain-containing protein [Pirellulaceae bacterium]